jgi:hypothetical protein
MKIQAHNAPAFVRHLSVIQKLSGVEHPYSFEILEKLYRLEAQAHRLTVIECNTGEDQDAKLDKIKDKVQKLLPNAKTLFINGDPRGYALKLKADEAKELNMYTDFGSYGILCPEF